jgi:anti-sigma B factor antagonist
MLGSGLGRTVGMEIRERELEGIMVLDLMGKVTRGESEELLRDRILDLTEGGHTCVIINLSGVPYIDSSGLGELVRCFTSMRRSGGRVGLTQLNRRLVDLFRITKLADIFETYDTDADAARSLRK